MLGKLIGAALALSVLVAAIAALVSPPSGPAGAGPDGGEARWSAQQALAFAPPPAERASAPLPLLRPAAAEATGPLLEVGAVRQRLGAEGDPVRVVVRDYKEGESLGRIWIATVDPARSGLAVVPSKEPAALGAFVPFEGDFVAINGGFYDAEKPMGLVVAGGRTVAPLRTGGGSGVFLVRGGKPSIVHRSDTGLKTVAMEQAVQSIDRLVDGGRILVNHRPELPHDARSAVAIDDRGLVHFVAAIDQRAIVSEQGERIVLGPASTATGPTLHQLAEWMARPREEGGLAARTALNLDGGFSTALRVQIGSKRIDIAGYRGTINALVAKPR